MNHTLKCHPAMFRASRDGRKPFQVRKDDRAYQTGDTVTLTYHDPNVPQGFPAPPIPFDSSDDKTPLNYRITFVLRGGQCGVEPGYVVLGLVPADFG